MPIRTSVKPGVTALLLLSAGGWALNAGAQSVANAGGAAMPTDALQEIVVTAQKRTERLQDVPVSVTALDAASLAEQNVLHINDYLARVPGLAANEGPSGRVNLAIRGITTGTTTNPTVGVTIDDVPIGSSIGTAYGDILVPELDPAILERIEVLRGPQGTLYGASSLGGLLKYVTTPPKLDQSSGRVEVDGTSVDHGGLGFGMRGLANVPLISDHLAATVSGFFRRDPGYVDDPSRGLTDVNRVDTFGGRGSTLWQISDSVALRVSALYQGVQGHGSAEVDADNSLQPLGGKLAQTRIVGTGGYERQLQLYDANLSVDLGGATLTSVTGYQRSKFMDREDGSSLSIYTLLATGRSDLGTTVFFSVDTNKFSQEIRLASSGERSLDWLIGGFFTREASSPFYNISATDLTSGALVAPVLPDSFPQTFQEAAGFGDLTYHFTDKLDLQVGGRYSANKEHYHETIPGPIFDPPYDVSADSKDHAVTYLATPRYRFSPDLMIYARVASGYRPGGPNPGAGFGFPATFHSDTTESYELGFKGELLAHRLTLDLASFYIKWANIQLLQIDPVSGFAYYTNAGEASSRGAEATVTALPMASLTLTGTFGYTDATLDQDANGDVVGHAGDPLPFSAKITSSLFADKRFTITSDFSAFTDVGVNYVGRRFAGFSSDAPVPRLSMPAFATLDLRAGAVTSDWTLTLFANNVTDKLGVLSAVREHAARTTGRNFIEVEHPRTIGFSASKAF